MPELRNMWCEECQAVIIPIDGVTALWAYGQWYCAKHCDIAYWEKGSPVVAVPSRGQMQPADTYSTVDVGFLLD